MTSSRIEIRQPEPEECFDWRFFPAGRPLFMRWVAIADDRKHFPGWTCDRALSRARRYTRDRNRARASREVVDDPIVSMSDPCQEDA